MSAAIEYLSEPPPQVDPPSAEAPELVDTFGRRLDYLRISVTDRCNFRCQYCMPPEGLPTLPTHAWLSFAEIARFVRLYVGMGGRRVRLTGGEPLLRPGLDQLVGQLADIEGLEDLALTTNGYHLETLAPALRAAGLQRVNVSLDSLDPARFAQLTLSTHYARVRQGVEASLHAGLVTKVNVVVLAGMTTDEMIAFGRLAAATPLEVRFIEFMPLCGTGWHPEWMLPLAQVRETLAGAFRLTPLPRGREVAQSFQIDDGPGRVGFIASMTESFCHDCSRLRLTADGKIRPCLFSTHEIDVRTALRAGDDAAVRAAIRAAVIAKPAGHGIDPAHATATELPRIRFVGG